MSQTNEMVKLAITALEDKKGEDIRVIPTFTAPEKPVFSGRKIDGISRSFSHSTLPSVEPLSTTRILKSFVVCFSSASKHGSINESPL